ncbi:replication initiation protein, partial [Klebsiella pneumoniae]|uniref:replication initiation protein n=1 Tax=Klebsiella pneumoniae TaxID=573 RepID=UPI0015C5EEB5
MATEENQGSTIKGYYLKMILQKEYSRSDFINQIISKPFCTDDFNRDGIYRANKRQALNKVYIEHNNDSFINSIVFDIDTETAAIAWQDANIPIPNFITQNPANGHAHLFYALNSPVCITDKANKKPQILLKGVTEGLTARFKCRCMLHRQDNKEPFKSSLE